MHLITSMKLLESAAGKHEEDGVWNPERSTQTTKRTPDGRSTRTPPSLWSSLCCIGITIQIGGVLLFAVALAIARIQRRFASGNTNNNTNNTAVLSSLVVVVLSLPDNAWNTALRWLLRATGDEPPGRRRRNNNNNNTHRGSSSSQPPMTVAESLRAFNRERSARGEATVSPESIVAYEGFLRDLATSVVIAHSAAATSLATETNNNNNTAAVVADGIPRARLETICPRWTMDDPSARSHNDCKYLSQTECGICLEAYRDVFDTTTEAAATATPGASSEDNGIETNIETNNDRRHGCEGKRILATLRTLPCKHVFHSRCIDQWLERSTSCPTCKQSILPHGLESIA